MVHSDLFIFDNVIRITLKVPSIRILLSIGSLNQRTNGPVNAHLISGPTVSTKKKKQILTSIKGSNSVANL